IDARPGFFRRRGAAALRDVGKGRIAARHAAPGGRPPGPRRAVAARKSLNAVAFLSRGGYVGARKLATIGSAPQQSGRSGGAGVGAGADQEARRGMEWSM